MSLKLVERTTMGDSSEGRPPIILTLTAKAGYCTVANIGMRHINLISTDPNDDIISRQSLFIEKKVFSYMYQQIYVATDKIIREIPPCPYGPIGISLAAHKTIDLGGVIRSIPKLQWYSIDIKSLLEQRYDVSVYIDNDGNLTAFMESRLHPQYEGLVVLYISDVISCGMIFNDQFICGYLGFANTVGHYTVNIQETEQCSCGKYGCWEQHYSDQYLLDEINFHLEKPLGDIDEFIELVKKQHPSVLAILDTYIHNLAIGLPNIIFFVNCEMIILNSHLIQSLPYLLPEIMKDIVLPITHTQEILVSLLRNEGPILETSPKVIGELFGILSIHS